MPACDINPASHLRPVILQTTELFPSRDAQHVGTPPRSRYSALVFGPSIFTPMKNPGHTPGRSVYSIIQTALTGRMQYGDDGTLAV